MQRVENLSAAARELLVYRSVALLIARGMANREIAEELVIGVRTVEAHITRILTRLNFNSRTEVAIWAAANGLGPRPGSTAAE